MFKKFPFLQRFLFVQFCYLAFGVFSYLMLYYLGILKVLPDADNILSWDAYWYKSIVEKGYIHHWFEASNTAFFPFFPYVWKACMFNSIGISVFNYVAYSIGLYMLLLHFNGGSTKALVFMSFPSCIFFFLPYTESLFFLCGALFLVGLKKENNYYIVAGLILCSITRATAMFFIPSLIIMQLFHANTFMDKKTWKNLILYCIATAIGFFSVVLFQFSRTGVWFGFAKQQIRFWLHKFSFPGFPIISHGYDNVLWLDGLSFFIGIVATFLLIYFGIQFLLGKLSINRSRAYWFSLTYIFMLTVYSLFFNAKSFEGSTMILSMNRYLFATPFFFLFFIESFQKIVFNKKTIIFLFISALISWIALGLGGPVQFLDILFKSQLRSGIFFIFMTFYVGLYFFTEHKKYGNHVAGVLFFMNVFLSCLMLHTFISGKWVA